MVFSTNYDMASCISTLVNKNLLSLADDKCCAQFDSILLMLPKYCRENQADCAGCVQYGQEFPTVCINFSY